MNFWRKLKNCIKSPSFIKEVYGESTGQTFKYLILLFTLVFLIVAIPVTVKGMQNVQTLKKQFAQVPDFKLENGQLHFFGPQPYVRENNGVAFIVDTTGKTTEADLNKYDNGFLFTKTKIYEKVGDNTQIVDYSRFKGTTIDKAGMQSIIGNLDFFILLLIVPAYIFYLGRKILGILIFASVAMTMARRKELFPFNKAFKVAVYASTLAIFVQAMFMLAPVIMPLLPTFIYIMIVTWYMIIAIRAIENET